MGTVRVVKQKRFISIFSVALRCGKQPVSTIQRRGVCVCEKKKKNGNNNNQGQTNKTPLLYLLMSLYGSISKEKCMGMCA